LPFKEGRKETLKFMVFGEGDDLPKEYNIELPYSAESFKIDRIVLKDKLFIQGGEWIESLNGKRKVRKYKRHLISIDLETNELMNYDYNLGDDVISDHKFIADEEGNIIIAGFYSHWSSTGVKGIFYLQIDGDAKTVSTAIKTPFSDDFLISNYSDEKQEKMKMEAEEDDDEIEMSHYNLNYLILNEDGGVTMVGEYYRSHVYTSGSHTTGSLKSVTAVETYYKDIIICSVDAQGEITWATRVPKNQKTKDLGSYCGYSMFIGEDRIHFVYNSHIDNLEEEHSEEMSFYRVGKSGCINLGTVLADGSTSREVLIGENVELFLRPKYYRQLNDEELLVLLVKGKQKQFAKIKF
jgi:hypothetical protein